MKICQSCGLPFDEGHADCVAKEKDGSDSMYCIFCYEDGEFLKKDATLSEMVEMGVPHLARKIGEEQARKQLSELLPTLRRWKKC